MAGRRSGAGRGGAGRRRVGPPRTFRFPGTRRQMFWIYIRKNGLMKSYVNRTRNTTSGRRLVGDRFTTGTASALVSWLLTNRSSPICLCSRTCLHEKGLQRQKGVVPLVSSQEQRALLVPLINRGSTGHFVPPSVYIGFRLFVLLGIRSGDVSSML